jgi:DNA-binding beta-propeller fold protein YncE
MKSILLNLLLIALTMSSVLSQAQVSNLPVQIVDSSLDPAAPERPELNLLSAAAFKIQSLAPAFSFDENPYNHNMHITSDGDYYYTINGGNSSNGVINKFSMAGVLLQAYPIAIDGRGLSYNEADGFLYASLYGGDVVRIDNLSTGSFTSIFPGVMQNGQGSFAISPDGSKFYNFSQGTLMVHDFTSGVAIDTIAGLMYGPGNFGGEAAVAVDSGHIYTWNANIKTVYIYDLTGALLQSAVLDSGSCGISLAIANGYLFVSKDGNYALGTWYGYNISGATGTGPEMNHEAQWLIYPNPTKGIITFSGEAEAIEIYTISGTKIYEKTRLENSNEADLSNQARGIYFVKIREGTNIYNHKIIVE